jgi:hypothetical protein
MEVLYCVAKNNNGKVESINIIKETKKTYVLDNFINKIVKKETMSNNYCRYFLKEDDAKVFKQNLINRDIKYANTIHFTKKSLEQHDSELKAKWCEELMKWIKNKEHFYGLESYWGNIIVDSKLLKEKLKEMKGEK